MKKTILLSLGACALAMGGAALGSNKTMAKAEADVAVEKKTLYLIANWADWDGPLLHYWGGSESTDWDNLPHMQAAYLGTVGSSEQGTVYKYDIPVDTTAIAIRKSNLSAQTADYNFGTTFGEYVGNSFHFVWSDNQNKIEATTISEVQKGAYMRGEWENGWNALGQKQMYFVSEGIYSLTTTYQFSSDSNSSLKMVLIGDNANVSWYNPTAVEGNCPTKGFNEGENAWIGANNLRASVTVNGGTYIINSDNSEGLVDAIDFATRFTDAMHGACPISSAHVGYDAVATQWNTFLAEFRDSLSDKAKAQLKSGTSLELVAFRNMYSIVLGRSAGVSAFPDFDLAANRSILAMSSNEANVGLAAPIAIAVSVLAIGGFFLLRKKRAE